mmetsp:Transcript_20628/g.62968  ORF Transcript_20628/g.62968 Transcript_20628/m.62968 type:complete len:248 (+) Transcript_20628:2412-3155(+)
MLQLGLPAVERVRTNCGEKVTIVRDDHQSMLPLLQVALQPDDGMEVEVVGWLVEQQQPWLAEERAGEGDAHPPAARKGGGGHGFLLLEKLQAGEDCGRALLSRVSADVRKLIINLREARGNLAVRVKRVLNSDVAVLVDLLEHGHLTPLILALGANRERASFEHLLLDISDAAFFQLVGSYGIVLVQRHIVRIAEPLEHTRLVEQRSALGVGEHNHLQRSDLVRGSHLLLDEKDVGVRRDGLLDVFV